MWVSNIKAVLKQIKQFTIERELEENKNCRLISKTFLICCFQFYDNLVETGRRFLTLNQPSQAGIMYHSKSNLLGFRLRAYKPYVYTGFKLRYLAVGKTSKTLLFNKFVAVSLRAKIKFSELFVSRNF